MKAHPSVHPLVGGREVAAMAVFRRRTDQATFQALNQDRMRSLSPRWLLVAWARAFSPSPTTQTLPLASWLVPPAGCGAQTSGRCWPRSAVALALYHAPSTRGSSPKSATRVWVHTSLSSLFKMLIHFAGRVTAVLHNTYIQFWMLLFGFRDTGTTLLRVWILLWLMDF